MQVVDEEEFRLMKRMRDAKRLYKAAYEDLGSLKGQAAAAGREAEALKVALLAGFEDWYAAAVAAPAADDPFGDTGRFLEEPEELDDQEAFERLELERVAADGGAEQVAFFQAQKTRRATATQNSVALKQRYKNKRNH